MIAANYHRSLEDDMLLELISRYGWVIVFANVLLEQLGLPLPAYPAIIATAALGSASEAPAVVGIATAAALTGDVAWFLAGRRYGYRVLHALCRLSLSKDSCVRRTETFLERWGIKILLVAKFIPGLSAVILPVTGALGASWRVFLSLDLIGCALWAAVAVGLGRLFAHQLDSLLDTLDMLGHGALLVLALAFGAYVVRRWWERHRLIRRLRMARIGVAELQRIMQGEELPVIVDVRTATNRNLNPFRIPGAITLASPGDRENFHEPLVDVPRDRKVVLYCTCPNEISAALVANRLFRLGFTDVAPLSGGLDAWRAAGLPLDQIG